MSDNQKSVNSLQLIPIETIFADASFNSRGEVNRSDVVELSRNIERHGLLQPITVQPYLLREPYKWRIIIGHRRFEAVKMLNWKTIPTVIKEGLSDIDAFALNLIENINRKDLNIVQEARALERFKNAGVTLEDTAKRIGKSKGWVQIRFTLLNLDPLIQSEAAGGLITQEQIKDIASLPGRELQFQAVRNIKESRARGDKRALKVKKPRKNLLKRKERNISERGEMLSHVLDTIGPCIATRVLAWTNGDISTLEVHRDLQQFAQSIGKRYSIPKDLIVEAEPVLV
jgi:ParB family chromosome partitioning protein